MSAAIVWVLMAFIPPGDSRPPAMVIERFGSQAACESRLEIFRANTVTFACLPSRQITRNPKNEN
ncbi:hypothetical protein CAL20_09675 [Bordetella genomosp. 4]|uniref:Uncharacterized protein n=1 Tax=Bordetella genomosp. 4 TaxID=463044 RepID=A0A261U7M9_9BORD|nr:hypothetical protein CAL20_09675 [Bordetella genomosp. 4]